MRIVRCLSILLLLCLTLIPAALRAGPLAAPPLGDRWFSILMNDERTGFSHLSIDETPDGYRFQMDGSVKMTVLGFTRDASSRETYLVNRDLTLKSFSAEIKIDGSAMKVAGEVTHDAVRVSVESGGEKKAKTLKMKGRIYPPAAINLYPLMRGAKPGKVYKVQFFDTESIKVKEAEISVIGVESLPGGVEAIHMRNDLYSLVDNDVWVDMSGNTIMESVRDGLVVTRAEDKETANRFISEAALARKDLILDFSLVKPDRPIANPAAVKHLVVELSGFPANFPIMQGAGQKGERLDADRVRFTIERPLTGEKAKLESGQELKYLESTDRITADSPEIRAKSGEIIGDEKEPSRKVERLAGWVAARIEGAVTDSQSPLETLKERKGNCQSHARLYASLARAAGIPTRFVTGLVYGEKLGFVYHSWAESYVGEWAPVDPTFGQTPTDATHIKLLEGDSPDDMAPLAGIVGRIRAKINEQK